MPNNTPTDTKAANSVSELLAELEKEWVSQHHGDNGAGGNDPQEPIYELQVYGEEKEFIEWLRNKITHLTQQVREDKMTQPTDPQAELPTDPCDNCDNPNQMRDKWCGSCRFNAGYNFAMKKAAQLLTTERERVIGEVVEKLDIFTETVGEGISVPLTIDKKTGKVIESNEQLLYLLKKAPDAK